MKKVISIIYILTTILFANLEEESNKEAINISHESINIYSQVLNSKKVENNILLLPMDINQTILILKKYNKKREIFNHKKKSFREHPIIEELIELYTKSLKEDKELKVTSIMQFLSILEYQKSILFNLKKDLNEHNLSHESKSQLLDNIEDLIILDNTFLYSLIEVQNKFYAKNIKKYFSIMKKNPIKNIIFTDELYQKFLFYLNKGEELAFEGIKINDFTSFTKFVENELKISDEERNKFQKALTKDSKETFLYTAYWIRTQVYTRYIKKGDSYLMLIEKIKKQKEFFEKLKSL